MLHHRRPILQVLFVVATFTTSARVTRAERIVFESYVGNRPPEAERIAPLVRMVFERRGFTVDPKVLAAGLREHAYQPGISSPKAAEIGELLKRQSLAGENYFASGNFSATTTELGKLLTTIRQNPLALARTPKYRELAMRALVFYALAKGRQAQAPDMKPDEVTTALRERDDTMDELVRSFPSKVISARTFGEEAERLFLEARDRLSKAGRGSISIAVSDPDAVIYLNEIVHGTTNTDIGDIVPGAYRVLVQAPTGEARQYNVEVAANQVARLSIDWDMDSLIHINGSWVGLRFPTEKEHAKEALIIHQLLKNHAYAIIAATLTITRAHGHIAVIGTSYGVQNGRLLHSGIVELPGRPAEDEKQLNLLIDCLMRIPSGDGVQAVPHPEYTPLPDSATVDVFGVARPVPPGAAAAPQDVLPLPVSAAAEPHEVSKWLVAGGATATLSVAAVGLSMDNLNAKPIGYVALGAGMVLGGLAVYLFLDGASDSKAPRIAITPSRSELMVHWATKF